MGWYWPTQSNLHSLAQVIQPKKIKAGEQSPVTCCPDCGKDLSVWLDKACPAHMGRKGKGASKARTSEQAKAAANVRWERVRAAKKRGTRKGQNDQDQRPLGESEAAR